MVLHLLVADGNTSDARVKHRAASGSTSAEHYAAVIAQVAPGAECSLVEPADADAVLPAGVGLDAFDAVIVTGSSLHVCDEAPFVTRQVDFVRAALETGLPVFGSCWGLQLATVVAGGKAGLSPRGPEYGFARRIAPTGQGRHHPLLRDRPVAYDAPAVHGDALLAVPPGAVVLAENGVSVQAIEVRYGAGTFWGTQYHPELDLNELGTMLTLSAAEIVAAGLCRDREGVAAYVADLAVLHGSVRPDLAWRYGLDDEVLRPERRRLEIANFLSTLARPRRAGR